MHFQDLCSLLNVPNQEVLAVARDFIYYQDLSPTGISPYDDYNALYKSSQLDPVGNMDGPHLGMANQTFHIFNPGVIMANEMLRTIECKL